MDFIVDNYFWFVVGGIVVLMIIIGFIAEKTDFGRKPFSTKKKNDGKVDNEVPVESNTEDSPIVIPDGQSDNLDEFLLEDNNVNIEMPDELLDENSIDIPELNQEENNEPVEERPEDEIIEEPMPDLDIPEITDEEKETVEEVPESIEEDMVDVDSEDDVWKF